MAIQAESTRVYGLSQYIIHHTKYFYVFASIAEPKSAMIFSPPK